MANRHSYYELTHPVGEEERYRRERAKAMRYDEGHLRECIACLINNMVAEISAIVTRNTTSSYRASVDWENREDCFKYLAMKISVLGNGKMQVRCWVDVWDSEFKENGPVDTSKVLRISDSEVSIWLQSNQAYEDILEIFQFLLVNCYKHS